MVLEDSTSLQQTQHYYSAVTQMKQAISGAASGFITRTITQPLDVLKIRFQLQVEPLASPKSGTGKYKSIIQACRLIYREENILAFWKGHNSGQVLTMTYTIIQFWSYEQIDLRLRQYDYMQRHKNFTHFMAGALAGCLGTIASMPFDVVRTRVVGQDHGQQYKSMFQLLPIIAREEGVRGLFRGLGTTLVQIGPLIGSNFMIYHYIAEAFNGTSTHNGQDQQQQQNQQQQQLPQQKQPQQHHELPVLASFVTGATSGVLSKVILYPLDFIKKRLQLQGFLNARRSFGRNHTCAGFLDCVRKTLHEEKFLGFYKGLSPTLLKSGVTSALYFSVYDTFKRLLGVENGH